VVQERRLMPAPVKKLFEALEEVAPDIFIEKKPLHKAVAI